MPVTNPTIPYTQLAGDLSGNLPRPTVTRILGRPLSNIAPTVGQVLQWNGTEWTATTPYVPPPPTPSPRTLTLHASYTETKNDSLAPELGGVVGWLSADFPALTAVHWRAASMVTNSLDPMTLELWQYTGTGSPQLVASMGNNLAGLSDTSVDVTTFFTSSPPDGSYGIQFYLSLNNGIDKAIVRGSWLEFYF